MKILISPYAKKTKNNNESPKNYPFWSELVWLVHENGIKTTQLGLKGDDLIGCSDNKFDLNLVELQLLLDEYDTFISVDSFFQHFAWYYNKKGIVLWGPSNPNIFGHKEHLNLIENIDNIRKDQFLYWENEISDNFVKPNAVITALKTFNQQ